MTIVKEETGKLTPTQQKIIIAVVALFLLSIYLLRSIYIPIFISYFLAFLINPIVRKMEKKGFGRLGPIFLILVLVFVFLGSFTIVMVPRILVQLREVFHKLPLLMDFLSTKLGPTSVHYLGYDMFVQWKDVVPSLLPEFGSFPAAGILESVLSGTARALSILITVLMIPILTFYILKDYYVLNEKLLLFIPRRFVKDVQEVMHRLSVVLGSLIRGQFVVCGILAVYYSIALNAIGLDMALLMGIFSGMMNLVPFVGPLVSLFLALFMGILGGAQITQCVAVVGVYLVANLVDGTVLTPKIVGRQMGISPLVLILTLLAGGELLGFLGLLLALPILAMVKVVGGYMTERYFASSYYQEENQLEGRQTLSDRI